MALQPDIYASPDEYLARERTAPFKSEYLDGVCYAMSGASEAHNLIVANLIGELRSGLKGSHCRVYPSDLKVGTPSGRFFYPDGSVICGPTQHHDDQKDVILNPTILIEVLSASTEYFDRGKKFLTYQGIPTLKEYILVSQDEPIVEHFVRDSKDGWHYTTSRGLESSLKLPSIGCTLALSEIYLNVTWGQEPEGSGSGLEVMGGGRPDP